MENVRIPDPPSSRQVFYRPRWSIICDSCRRSRRCITHREKAHPTNSTTPRSSRPRSIPKSLARRQPWVFVMVMACDCVDFCRPACAWSLSQCLIFTPESGSALCSFPPDLVFFLNSPPPPLGLSGPSIHPVSQSFPGTDQSGRALGCPYIYTCASVCACVYVCTPRRPLYV